ncbi:class I SAM-dependent methyltransferase [Propionivibrio limicola]|uniref:class I SAM-dependent methyltransferase n=1 Tax=Propionivibrio limicola TaxID=167645 RepID=UPI001291EDC7|nr:class I SAM-dependent methyltransferase [Propionivibrio limicola]
MNTNTQPALAKFYEPILQRIQKHLADQVKIPFGIRLWEGRVYRFGEGEPTVDIVVNDRRGLIALSRFDELSICEAYMTGSLDVVGNMLPFVSLRGTLNDSHPLHYLWRRIAPWLIGRVTTNRQAIAAHYEFDNDFYLKFLDPSRCYSQAVFECDDEPLETAQRRKLDFAIQSCRLEPGDRVLDVGCGWGSFTEHAGRRGIQVTSLTISRQSEKFVKDLILRLQLPAQVLNQDFLTHRSAEPYDAIVILGVMEHLPDYPGVLQRFQQLLKPGGRVYLDASAFREKHVKPTFVSRYIFPGDHSFFCLHDFLTAVSRTQLDVLEVYNDRNNYFLTCKAWAEKLEVARDEIIRCWGEELYRRFRLYLWGSAYAFLNRGMGAYRVVLERPHEV